MKMKSRVQEVLLLVLTERVFHLKGAEEQEESSREFRERNLCGRESITCPSLLQRAHLLILKLGQIPVGCF